MINTELYTLNHGSIQRKQQAYIDTLEAYFKPRRENVVGVTILPNFCIDKDMTNYIHHLYPDLKEFNIYRGLLVELRTNYKVSKGDVQWIYPQLCKQRGLCELPTTCNIDTVISRIKDMKELKLDDLKNKIEDKKFMLSPLYNNLTVYETTHRDSEWGTQVTKHILGYDISCDKFIIPFWKVMLCSEEIHISDFYNKLATVKIEGNTTKNLINDSAKGVVEYITDKAEADLKFITDLTTNWFFRNDREYFFFNHGVNLLGLNRRPMALQTSMLAGLKMYKNIVTNAHPYKYVFPYDCGLTGEYHTYNQMTKDQQARLNKVFYWNKDIIPFNTYLMSKVNQINNAQWRAIETKLEVIPDNFFSIVFSRISTHNVYHYMEAKDIIKLQPGDNKTEIYFPLKSNHLITKLMIDNYEKLKHFNIIDPQYYDKQKQMLVLPRHISELILSYQRFDSQ
tara:strand:- start:328 stop:1683 length:1356 start_codon:yes stop_codon:yes gene_type:complete